MEKEGIREEEMREWGGVKKGIERRKVGYGGGGKKGIGSRKGENREEERRE